MIDNNEQYVVHRPLYIISCQANKENHLIIVKLL